MSRRLNVCLLGDGRSTCGDPGRLADLAQGLDGPWFRALTASLRKSGATEVKPSPRNSMTAFVPSDGWFPGKIRKLASFLREEEVDLVHAFGDEAAAAGLAAAFIAGTPARVVSDCRHGAVRVLSGAAGRLARFADLTVAASETARDVAMSRGVRPDSIRVVSLGVAGERASCPPEQRSATRASLGIRTDEPVVGTFASLTSAGGLEAFLLSAAIVRRHVPSTRFLILGDGPARTGAERLAWGLGLGGAAVFAGLPRLSAPYIAAMDIAVVASTGDEPCDAFALEAMGLARPIIAPETAVNRELLAAAGAGLLTPPDDSVAMATAALRILTAPGLADAYGAQGRVTYRMRHTLRDMIHAYGAIYAELWERKRGERPGLEPLALEDAR